MLIRLQHPWNWGESFLCFCASSRSSWPNASCLPTLVRKGKLAETVSKLRQKPKAPSWTGKRFMRTSTSSLCTLHNWGFPAVRGKAGVHTGVGSAQETSPAPPCSQQRGPAPARLSRAVSLSHCPQKSPKSLLPELPRLCSVLHWAPAKVAALTWPEKPAGC